MIDKNNAITGAMKKYSGSGKKYPVKKRGRPERHPREAARTILRRQRFGGILRDLRLARSLSLHDAATAAGISSARKLAQYETTCYPSGDVLRVLAPIYRVTDEFLGLTLLRHSDPALYESIRGEPGYEPTDLEIKRYCRQLAKMEREKQTSVEH